MNRGLAVREVAKQAHVSFSFNQKVRTKMTGDANEVGKGKKEPMSIP